MLAFTFVSPILFTNPPQKRLVKALSSTAEPFILLCNSDKPQPQHIHTYTCTCIPGIGLMLGLILCRLKLVFNDRDTAASA